MTLFYSAPWFFLFAPESMNSWGRYTTIWGHSCSCGISWSSGWAGISRADWAWYCPSLEWLRDRT